MIFHKLGNKQWVGFVCCLDFYYIHVFSGYIISSGHVCIKVLLSKVT